MEKDNRISAILAQVWFPAVARTEALYTDLMFLYKDEAKFSSLILPLQIQFTDHIGQVAKGKPHVLLAYSHVLYLALFTGGRITRPKIMNQPNLFTASSDKDSQEEAAMKATKFLR